MANQTRNNNFFIEQSQLPKDQDGDQTFNSLISALGEAASSQLKFGRDTTRGPIPVDTSRAVPVAFSVAVKVLTALSSAVTIAGATGIGVPGMTTANPDGSRVKRDFKVEIHSDKWGLLLLRIGFVEATIILPPVDMDVNVKVSMFNEKSDDKARRTGVIAEYISIGDIDRLVELGGLSGEEIKNSGAGITLLSETFTPNDLFLQLSNTDPLPVLLLSNDATTVHNDNDINQKVVGDIFAIN